MYRDRGPIAPRAVPRCGRGLRAQTENELFQLPFRAAYAFRPAYIQPLNGIVPKTAWLRAFYAVVAPLYPVWKRLFPKYVTTTAQIGRAMIHVAREGAPKRVLESQDINEICEPAPRLTKARVL